MPAVTSYFDLARNVRPSVVGRSTETKPAVLPQYLALAAGVFAEPLLHSYIAERSFGLNWGEAWQQLLFGLIAAVVIFPGVYRSAFDPERPFLVQLCAIFASGIGWQSLFQAATGGSSGLP